MSHKEELKLPLNLLIPSYATQLTPAQLYVFIILILKFDISSDSYFILIMYYPQVFSYYLVNIVYFPPL